MAVAAFIELKMGRLPMCKCGYVKLWAAVNSPELSQQIVDCYSFSHIIHGFGLYGFFHIIGRGKWPIGFCLVLAIFAEASWEVLENTTFIIERYRHSTLSMDYYGDSIVNSMSDILFAVLGFVLAAYLPVSLTLSLIVAMEVAVGYAIRDNLTLNIIMLIYPVEAIKHWQLTRGF
jgi:hypothetical protein